MATFPLVSPARQAPGRTLRVLVLVGSLLGALLVVGTSVFADLNATASNTSAHSVSSGTLKLTMANDGIGFGQSISGLVPGDVVHRFVTLTNGGTLDGSGLTLAAAVGSSNKLSSDGTNGLQVLVDRCSVAWNTGAATCSGTSTQLSSASLASMIANPATLTGFSTFTAGAVIYLRITVSLPNQAETTVNGLLPANTIQGLTAAVTWTFEEKQRTATETSA